MPKAPKIQTPSYPYTGRVANYAGDQGGMPTALSAATVSPVTSATPAASLNAATGRGMFGHKTLLGGL